MNTGILTRLLAKRRVLARHDRWPPEGFDPAALAAEVRRAVAGVGARVPPIAVEIVDAIRRGTTGKAALVRTER